MDNRELKFSYLRKPEVLELTGLSYSTIFRMERRGEFPKRRKLSSNIVAWRSDEITEWMLSRDVVCGGVV